MSGTEIETSLQEELRPKLRGQIERLQEANFNLARVAVPFIPYVGNSYNDAKNRAGVRTRILIVGKATDGWGWKEDVWNKEADLRDVSLHDHDWYQKLRRVPKEFVERKVVPYYSGGKGYSSLFWNRVYRIAADLLHDLRVSEVEIKDLRKPELCRGCFDSIAWTNVFKIGGKRGNPAAKLRKPQIELNTLSEEIRIVEPDVVLFFTAPGYDRFLCKVLPNMRIDDVESGIARISGLAGLANGGVAIRTYHPQASRPVPFDPHPIVEYVRANRRSS